MDPIILFPPKKKPFSKPGKQPGGFSVLPPSTAPGTGEFPGDEQLDCPHCATRAGSSTIHTGSGQFPGHEELDVPWDVQDNPRDGAGPR